MYRQWDRAIEDDFLKATLSSLPLIAEAEKVNLIITHKFISELKRRGISTPRCAKNAYWVLVLKADLLITIYAYADTNFFNFIEKHRRQKAVII